MMLPPEIAETELLYRGITEHPFMWKSAENRPSSAAFKSENLSVDREGGRNEEDVCAALGQRLSLQAVVRIQALACRSCGTDPVARPTDDNPYHAEIHHPSGSPSLSSGQARCLATTCSLVSPTS